MEEWAPIEGYEDLYEVSTLGRVRRIGGAQGATVGAILKPQSIRSGHLVVNLFRNSKGRKFLVHRLVASAFLPPPEDPSLFVCHKDGDPTNNAPSNLYWGTAKENAADMVKHGRSTKGRATVQGESHGCAKLSDNQVDEIRIAHSKGESQASLAKRFAVSPSAISSICKGKSWGGRPFPDGATPKSTIPLTGEQVDEIRLAMLRGETHKDIAKRFGVARTTISGICTGRSWKHRPFPRLAESPLFPYE